MARRDNTFRIEWEGIDEFLRMVDRVQEFFAQVVVREYRQYGLLLEKVTKHLVPEDSGDLASTINLKVSKSANRVTIEVGTNHTYALRRHEEPYRQGTYDKYDNGSKFPNYYVNGRGATTRAKGAYKGYLPGRKYLTNAVKATEREYEDMLERIMRKALGGG